MFPVIGILIVFGAIIGGYVLEEGNVYILFQPAEFLIIGGAAIGSIVLTCPPKLLSQIVRSIPKVFGGSNTSKQLSLDLLTLLYNIFTKIRKEGLLAVEKDIEEPEKSPLFKTYPQILKDHHLTTFIRDNLRLFVIGLKPMELEEMMELELESHHEEVAVPPSVILKVGDSLPGFGIVAAVLGVTIVMGKMGESPEVIGHGIAAALVGTFLGILLCYGLFAPIGNHLEHKARDETKLLEATKASILAFAKGLAPQMAVEAGRRVLFSDVRPTFGELEEALRKKKAA